MHPILFTIASFPVRSELFFSTLALLAALWLGIRLAAGFNSTQREWQVFLSGLLLCAYLGGALNGMLFNLDVVMNNFNWHRLLFSGWISYGGILGALLFSLFGPPRYAWKMILQRTDIVAVVLSLFEGIYRIGCLLKGCCYGLPNTGFGAMFLPDLYGNWMMRFPTQMLYIILGFGLFLLLLWHYCNGSQQGRLAVVYLVLYGIGRLAIDAMRGDAISLGVINLHQAADLFMVLLGIIAWVVYKRIMHPPKRVNAN